MNITHDIYLDEQVSKICYYSSQISTFSTNYFYFLTLSAILAILLSKCLSVQFSLLAALTIFLMVQKFSVKINLYTLLFLTILGFIFKNHIFTLLIEHDSSRSILSRLYIYHGTINSIIDSNFLGHWTEFGKYIYLYLPRDSDYFL